MKTYKYKNQLVIENKLIPFKGFTAINIFGIIFTKDISSLNETVLNHELIHTEQILDCLIIFYYPLYFLEWFIKLFIYGKDAYYNISFEREAYMNSWRQDYVNKRKRYNWIHLIWN